MGKWIGSQKNISVNRKSCRRLSEEVNADIQVVTKLYLIDYTSCMCWLCVRKHILVHDIIKIIILSNVFFAFSDVRSL